MRGSNLSNTTSLQVGERWYSPASFQVLDDLTVEAYIFGPEEFVTLDVRVEANNGLSEPLPLQFVAADPPILTAPVAIFEILSPTTELLDRTEKRRDYQRLGSLRHYVLIAQDAPRVEVYTRGDRGWRFEEIEGLVATLPLEALGIVLPVGEIYDGLQFPRLEAVRSPDAASGESTGT